jgi:hypothetical protein
MVQPACWKAATGSEARDYRSGESVHIRRSSLPPSAVCQWSGGATAALAPVNALSWAGPILMPTSALMAPDHVGRLLPAAEEAPT